MNEHPIAPRDDTDDTDDQQRPGQSQVQHLYLVRHGRTALNAEGRLRGLANPPLDSTGVAEAQHLARVLADKGAILVASSPLDRAQHTARIIADAAGIRHVVDDRFNDRDYGPQTGRVKAEVESEWGTVDQAPGVEPAADVLQRARPALDDLVRANAPQAVVVVTHDAVIRPLIAAIDPQRPRLVAPTGSWNELTRDGTVWSVTAVDQKPGTEQPRDG